MKDKIDDLRQHLFAELERLGDEGLEGEALDKEIQRAKAVQQVAGQVIATAKAETDRLRLVAEHGIKSGSALLGKAEQTAGALEDKSA